MTLYAGARTIDGIQVTADGRPLDPRYDLKRFTRGGFEWTYEGPEPSQLALALLADRLGDGEKAVALTEPFMRKVIANLENDWQLTGAEIDRVVAELGG